MDDEDMAVVIDNGSGLLKAGFSGEDGPRSVIPNMQGSRLKGQGVGLCFAAGKDSYIGRDAQERRHILKLKYPIENGTIVDFDAMTDIWNYVYEFELRHDTDRSPVLITEVINTPRKNREFIAQVMFETFAVPALYVATQTVGLYASGRTSGIVVSCGEGVTFVTATFDGYPIASANVRSNIAGAEITNFLGTTLSDRGHYLTTSAEREIVRDIKEDLCYVSLNYERDVRIADKMPKLFEKNYILPDGQALKIGAERFMCPEALFNPNILAEENSGVHHLVYKAISECGIDTRKVLWENIVVTGGCSLLPNFAERLRRELIELVPATINPKVFAPPERKYSMWIGGSRLASLPSFRKSWVNQDDYFEDSSSVFTTA
eukprot:TRINITY_DN9694_c0_g1_i1.p1 TRINITY_DN9694_c0_g1~~TRINITY_DN9694_c0_g1_i1.p1  ORF type:complete len:376 (+),score=112.92 TRINITY_DN9694_c0_g1_i1:83-1210(+)